MIGAKCYRLVNLDPKRLPERAVPNPLGIFVPRPPRKGIRNIIREQCLSAAASPEAQKIGQYFLSENCKSSVIKAH
jgi:hypothetical protein